MNLDIKTALQTSFFLLVIGIILCVVVGIRSIHKGSRLSYFKKKQEMIVHGWRLMAMSLVLAAVTFFVYRYAEPTIYQFFPPSPYRS